MSDRPIRARLARARAQWRRRRSLEAAADGLGFVLPGLAILFLLGFLVPPATAWSAIAGLSASAWIAIGLAWRFGRPIARPVSLNAYAVWLERRAGIARNEVVNAYYLERDRAQWDATSISRDLVDLALERARERLAGLPYAELHRSGSLRPGLLRGGAAVAIFVTAGLVAPLRASDSARLFLSAGSRAVIPPITVLVTPGDARLERGEPVTVRAEVQGRRRPRRAELEMRTPGAPWVRARMTAAEASESGVDRYGYVLSGLSGDLEYRVHTLWQNSASYQLHVVERLQASGYRKTYTPPAYTGLAPQSESSMTGDLAAVSGTDVSLTILHRCPGATGRLAFTDGRALPLQPVSTGELRSQWMLTESGDYVVELLDSSEGEAWRSDSFRVEVMPDLPPAVRLVSPPAVITMPPDMRVRLEIECVDDFGLGEIALIYGRATDDPARRVLADRVDGKEARVTFDWNLEELTLLPGQELHYFIQVFDNDALHGPKPAETELATIRFPSLAEMYAAAEQERKSDIADLEQTLQGQQMLRQELADIAREMLRDESMSWERQQEVQDLIARQEQLAAKIESLRQSLDVSQKRMENQNLFSMEMIDQVRQIRELVDQIQSREFRDLLEKMRQAVDQLDRDSLKRAMQEMKLTQEEISQALDRTLAMLKRLLAAEKVDQLAQKIAELGERQAELNRRLDANSPGDTTRAPVPGETPPESSAPTPSDSTAAGEQKPLTADEASELRSLQEQIAKDLEALKRALDELQKTSAEDFQQLAKALEEYRKGGDAEKALEQMRRAEQALKEGSRPLALKFGRKAREGLQQMQAGMMSMRQSMSVAEAEAIARSLYTIANRMVTASQLQEALVSESPRMSPRDWAVREQELAEELAVVGDSLMAVARKTPVVTRDHLRQLGDALRDVVAARDQLESGRRPEAVASATTSTQKLNTTTKSLLEAATQARGMCSSNCPNPFNQMQSLTGQQNTLNQETQQLMGACQTPRLSLGQQEAMMRLAARQEAIRQGLEDIRSQVENSGQAMRDLGSAVDEMEEVVREMKSRKVEPKIIQRQERILSRMLEAQRSIRKRDENEERQSRTGVNPVLRAGPGAVLTGESPVERLRRALLRGSKDPVPPEYRRMVEMYLRQLMTNP